MTDDIPKEIISVMTPLKSGRKTKWRLIVGKCWLLKIERKIMWDPIAGLLCIDSKKKCLRSLNLKDWVTNRVS